MLCWSHLRSLTQPESDHMPGFDDRDTDLFLCDTNTCKFDGECLRIGNMVTCICDFKCNNDYAPVCGSNNQNYQNECFLRRDACKQQSEVLIMSEGACPADPAGSSSVFAQPDSHLTAQFHPLPLTLLDAAEAKRPDSSEAESLALGILAHRFTPRLKLHDAGSGSGDDGEDGSAETAQKETSTCDICQFGAECDVDAEDV
ncbi:hypothetical protein KUCAC02_010235, partial [Chaenocephalus aceratus]